MGGWDIPGMKGGKRDINAGGNFPVANRAVAMSGLRIGAAGLGAGGPTSSQSTVHRRPSD